METYNNDYTREEDYMMWVLHEIRNKIAGKNLSCNEINSNGEYIVKKYGLVNIKSLDVSRTERK